MPSSVTDAPLCAPERALPGGRVACAGRFTVSDTWPDVRVGEAPALVAALTPHRLTFVVPVGVSGEALQVCVDDELAGTLSVGEPWVTGVHQVDSPLVSRDGRLYATCSGTRDQEGRVSIYRASPNGPREPFATGIRNPTSLAEGPDGALYVSSRFEGVVYRVAADGHHEIYARDLGVPTGLAWGGEGVLYAGDRSGRVLRIVDGEASTFAELPGSVAAFHLAMRPDGVLCVSAPTLAPRDVLYMIDRDGRVEQTPAWFGRPQGLAFDPAGVLHVADSLAGRAGVYRLAVGAVPEQVLSGAGVLGVAFGPAGEMAVATGDSVYRFPPR